MHLDDVAGGVFHHAVRGDEIGVAQADLFARRQAIILRRRHLAEIILLDVNLARERHLTRPGRWVFGIVRNFDELLLPSG